MKEELKKMSEALNNKLMTISESYEKNMRHLFEHNFDLEQLKASMIRAEMVIKGNVLNAKDSEGKKLYTNQEQREIALRDMLDRDTTYCKYKEDFNEMSKKVKELTTNIDILKYRKSCVIAQANMITAMINLTSAELTARNAVDNRTNKQRRENENGGDNM